MVLLKFAAVVPKIAIVRIEVPRGSFVKRRPDGSTDFVSPFPSPYNYGSVEGTIADDGDPLDAIVLGPRLRVGDRVEVPVRAVMGFVDAGEDDPKLVCSDRDLSAIDRGGVRAFFEVYARFKRVLYRIRRRRGRTACLGWL